MSLPKKLYFRPKTLNNMNAAAQNIPKIDVENVIAAKNPRLLKIIPKFLINKVKRIIHQDKINDFIARNHRETPYQFVKNGLTMFGANITIKGLENLPQNKRVILVSNHPLGGLDGLVFINTVYDVYGELRFPVNDLLLNLPALRDIFLPINKHGAHSRDALLAIEDAYKSEMPVLYFPAGLCSRKIKGKITDLEWKKHFVTQAIKHQRNVVPVHINGANSNFFYNLSNWRKRLGIKANIEMLYLVDEMYSQYHKSITISFGKPINWQMFDKSRPISHWVEFVRQKCYEME